VLGFFFNKKIGQSKHVEDIFKSGKTIGIFLLKMDIYYNIKNPKEDDKIIVATFASFLQLIWSFLNPTSYFK
jgi:hypothetical protein